MIPEGIYNYIPVSSTCMLTLSCVDEENHRQGNDKNEQYNKENENYCPAYHNFNCNGFVENVRTKLLLGGCMLTYIN